MSSPPRPPPPARPRFTGQLHTLCEDARWLDLENLLRTSNGSSSSSSPISPSALLERQGWNHWTPLMISCVRAPLSTIQLLIQACPESVMVADRSHSLPIHFVACWRRPAEGSKRSVVTTEDEFVSILRLLLEHGEGCLTSVNTWGQTPLHSAFDSDKECLDLASVLVLLGIEDFGEEVNEEVKEALLTPDAKSRLPIHIAAERCYANPLILGILAESCPASANVTTKEGALACHILNQTLDKNDDEEEIGYVFDNLCGKLTKDGCFVNFRGSLPLHIACERGVSMDVLEKMLDNHSESAHALLTVDEYQYPPIELFEEGRAGRMARGAIQALNSATPNQPLCPTDRSALEEIISDYHCRSDVLFSYFPMAVSSLGVPYRTPARLHRLENLIRSEATANGDLSTTSRLTWTWMCTFADGNQNYSANVGRIISNLDSNSLWKLTFVKTPLESQGQFVKVLSGRTVVLEAEERAPSTQLGDMFQHRWFFPSLLSFLEPLDALRASCVSHETQRQGVRSLIETDGLMPEGRWDCPEMGVEVPPQPWQRLELVVPECTHSFIVTGEVIGEGGGLLIVRSDKNGKPNDVPPWGSHVVASDGTLNSMRERELIVNHISGRSYGLWYYLPPTIPVFTIRRLRIRQILYNSDANNRTPLQMLLGRSRPPPRLDEKLTLLLQSHFTISSGADGVPTLFLHHALKCNVEPKTLLLLIESSPPCLLDTDKDQRTPLHASFLLSSSPPSPSIISSLLRTPGENALKLKDATGRLPLHIAAERGASSSILKLLVVPYPDSCYRVNKDGDLPLHLLVRSGNATAEGVSLLLKPIMHSESIVKIKGSGDEGNLPLHIACEYNVSLDILEELLKSYPGAAAVRRGSDGLYPLEILESRKKIAKQTCTPEEMDAKSDLLFVHYPTVVGGHLPPRLDETRINRIADYISTEITEHLRHHPSVSNPYLQLSLTANKGWIFLMTTSPQISEDEILPSETTIYRHAVERILHDHPLPSVAHFLSKVSYLKRSVVESASYDMQHLLLSSVRFCGRYELCHLQSAAGDNVVVNGRDYSLQEEYARLEERIRDKEEGLGDDAKVVTWTLLQNFGKRLGVGEKATKVLMKRLARKEAGSHEEECYSDDDDDETQRSRISKSLRSIVERGSEDDETEEESRIVNDDEMYADEGTNGEVIISSGTFYEFCRLYGVRNGIRDVCLKFFSSKRSFLREKASRKKLDWETNSPAGEWPVVPLLEDYDLDLTRPKDKLFARDVQEKNECVKWDLGRFRYCVVMPRGERDLKGIWEVEKPGILQVREFLLSVGNDLRKLHSKTIVHGNLHLDNIIRLPSNNLSLISLSSCYILNSSNTTNSSFPTTDYVCSDTHQFSSGYLPPELICKINTASQKNLLERYECYWKHVSDDAKDLKLLTPDDIQIISTVLKTLLARETSNNNNNNNNNPAISSMSNFTSTTPNRHNEWKDILSLALITISFDDLPHSLTCCKSIRDFSRVWNRLLSHSRLWEKIKPRYTEDQTCVYLIKSFREESNDDDATNGAGGMANNSNSDNNNNNNNTTMSNNNTNNNGANPALLPYNLIRASPKLDIWAFGMLTFTLCSSSHPLHVDARGDLRHADSFAQLFKWDKKRAELLIHEQIDDPLAQDLLLQILLPFDERIPTMDEVLNHPFFGPASALEAQWILEKHEEQQLMLEETAVISKMTTETTTRLENTTEKQCKIVFEEEKIVVPTCLIILPYELESSPNSPHLTVPSQHLDLAIRVGKHLLDINKATARLSFWLMMKKNMAGHAGQTFKSRLKDWLKRARTEPGDVVAREIVKAIGCGDEYIPLCREMLEKGDVVSQAKSYIKDPMGAARVAIRQSTEFLVKCFITDMQYLYLVDEYNGVPVLGENEVSKGFMGGGGGGGMGGDYEDEEDDVVYPINIDPNTRHLQNLFLPFVNISVMTVTAVDGLNSLKRLLGLPSNHSIPDSWKDARPGLVHKLDQPTSVAEFAVLQDVVRKQDQQATATPPGAGGTSTRGSFKSNHSLNSVRRLSMGKYDSCRSEISAWSESTFVDGSEMRQLEVFFREYDPMRMFSGLRRVSDSKGNKNNGSAIWTTEEVVRKIQGEVELASVETKLRELKKELAKQEKMKEEIAALTKQVRLLKRIDPEKQPTGGGGGGGVGGIDGSHHSRQMTHGGAMNDGRGGGGGGGGGVPSHMMSSQTGAGGGAHSSGGPTGGSSLHHQQQQSSSMGTTNHHNHHHNNSHNNNHHDNHSSSIFKSVSDYVNPNSIFNKNNTSGSHNHEDDARRLRRKQSKKKRRFRPYFSTC